MVILRANNIVRLMRSHMMMYSRQYFTVNCFRGYIHLLYRHWDGTGRWNKDPFTKHSHGVINHVFFMTRFVFLRLWNVLFHDQTQTTHVFNHIVWCNLGIPGSNIFANSQREVTITERQTQRETQISWNLALHITYFSRQIVLRKWRCKIPKQQIR